MCLAHNLFAAGQDAEPDSEVTVTEAWSKSPAGVDFIIIYFEMAVDQSSSEARLRRHRATYLDTIFKYIHRKEVWVRTPYLIY